jgi:hypothetical protein
VSEIQDTARAMTDVQLAAKAAELRRQIPAAQSLLSAIGREQKRRTRAKAKAKAA